MKKPSTKKICGGLFPSSKKITVWQENSYLTPSISANKFRHWQPVLSLWMILCIMAIGLKRLLKPLLFLGKSGKMRVSICSLLIFVSLLCIFFNLLVVNDKINNFCMASKIKSLNEFNLNHESLVKYFRCLTSDFV